VADSFAIKVTGLQEVERDLARIGVKLSDLDFRGIASEGMRLAASFAPKKSGKLAASIKGSKSKSRATIKAGGARVPYAAAINYGWRRRNIAPAGFMQRADEVLRRTVPAELEAQMKRIIAGQGMA
jgi:hypothetical protein